MSFITSWKKTELVKLKPTSIILIVTNMLCYVLLISLHLSSTSQMLSVCLFFREYLQSAKSCSWCIRSNRKQDIRDLYPHLYPYFFNDTHYLFIICEHFFFFYQTVSVLMPASFYNLSVFLCGTYLSTQQLQMVNNMLNQ